MQILKVIVFGVLVSASANAAQVSDTDAQRALANLMTEQSNYHPEGDVKPNETIASILAGVLSSSPKSISNKCNTDLTHDWPKLNCTLKSNSDASSIEIEYSFNVTLLNGKVEQIGFSDAHVFSGAR